MSRSPNVILVVAVLALAAGAAAPADDASPRTPYLDWGACPFECCVYGTWTASQATNVLTSRRTGAAVAFRLKPGDKVYVSTGVVVTTRPGRIRALEAVTLGEGTEAVSLKPGELIYILHYLGEGYHLLWFNGHTLSDEIEPVEQAKNLELLEPPETHWWVKIKNRSGRVGWSEHPEHFMGNDACG